MGARETGAIFCSYLDHDLAEGGFVKSGLAGEHAASNHRLIYTCA